MNINRIQLVAAIEKAIEEGRERHAQRVIAWGAYEKAERERWIEQNRDAWQKATTLIRKKLRQGEPIVQSDLPKDGRWRDSVALYSGPASAPGSPRKVVGEYRAPAGLLQLQAALSLVTDELVTVTALNKLGITASTIRFALDHIAGLHESGA